MTQRAEHEFDNRGICKHCGTSFAAYILEDYDCAQPPEAEKKSSLFWVDKFMDDIL